MPRRRFSQGAIKPIREMLLEIEEEENRQIEFEKESCAVKRNCKIYSRGIWCNFHRNVKSHAASLLPAPIHIANLPIS